MSSSLAVPLRSTVPAGFGRVVGWRVAAALTWLRPTRLLQPTEVLFHDVQQWSLPHMHLTVADTKCTPSTSVESSRVVYDEVTGPGIDRGAVTA
jgi:hypothetical protein